MLRLKSVNFEQQQFQNHQLEKFRDGQLEWLIGRSSNCDIVLSSPEVSRVHGRIVYSNDVYYFIDDGSMSGSLLNGETLLADDKRQIRSGDLLQLGETFLHIEELTPPSTSSIANPLVVCPPIAYPEWPWTDEDLMCRCCRIVDETPDVKTFYFVADPPFLFHYKPGQFANLEVEIDGKPIIRSYSIASSPTRPYHLCFTVKRVPSPPDCPDAPAGLVSNWLHDQLNVGDCVKFIGGPLGNFTCLPNLPSKLLLISAGSGITPMMSMSRWIQDAFADCDTIFLHSARTPEDIVFRRELEVMAAQLPNFHLAITLTRQAVGHAWMGLTGRISSALLQVVAPDFLDRVVYVCGPEAFMQSMKSTFKALQFPMHNYYEESFGRQQKKISQPHAVSSAISQPEATFTDVGNGKGNYDHLPLTEVVLTDTVSEVHFVQSGQRVVADGSTSVLELAEQEGIQIRNACRAGACGACKVRISQGQVRYDTPPTALTPTEKQAGYALACVAYPLDRLAVETIS